MYRLTTVNGTTEKSQAHSMVIPAHFGEVAGTLEDTLMAFDALQLMTSVKSQARSWFGLMNLK